METKLLTKSGLAMTMVIEDWDDIDASENGKFEIVEESTYVPFHINNMGNEAIVRDGYTAKTGHKKSMKLKPGWNEYYVIGIDVEAGDTLQWGI